MSIIFYLKAIILLCFTLNLLMFPGSCANPYQEAHTFKSEYKFDRVTINNEFLLTIDI